MKTQRRFSTLTTLPNSTVIAIGGEISSKSSTKSIEKYPNFPGLFVNGQIRLKIVFLNQFSIKST